MVWTNLVLKRYSFQFGPWFASMSFQESSDNGLLVDTLQFRPPWNLRRVLCPRAAMTPSSRAGLDVRQLMSTKSTCESSKHIPSGTGSQSQDVDMSQSLDRPVRR
jgi:hypothetical protein